jgi:AraC family transcriptional regulator of adaptative response/methylated-DNA-[protein]-cysteine methyltransferase
MKSTEDKKAQIRYAVSRCSLGAILVASTDKGVCAILLGDQPGPLVTNLQERFADTQLSAADAKLQRLVAKVIKFVESPRARFDIPLDARGTAFQQRVWLALQDIPVGKTVTYTDIAARIGAPKSVRAVASACAANAIAVAIPCHRVVRSDGGLSGYRWGVDRKRALLVREGAR